MQYFAGLLADEDLIQPKKIGTAGASHGGAKSISLGALRNRVMLPDGSLSSRGRAGGARDMEIAVAAPIVPPSDLPTPGAERPDLRLHPLQHLPRPWRRRTVRES